MEEEDHKYNPYVAGNPVGGSEAFIGRTNVFDEVIKILNRPNDHAAVLFGQRRIGKTSVLQELQNALPQKGNFQTVYFDLQDKAALSLGEVLILLAEEIESEVDIDYSFHDTSDIEKQFRIEFLPNVLTSLNENIDDPSQAISLVLLFDEFDILDEEQAENTHAAETFFPYLRNLLTLDPRLQFIFVIGRRPEDMSSLTLSVFKAVKSYQVSLLSYDELVDLVHLSKKNNSLKWPKETVDHIFQLTGGHPFLSQQLCQIIWDTAYKTSPSTTPIISVKKVNSAIPKTLSSSTNALEWLWDGLSPAQRIVTSALAEAGPKPISQEELVEHLHNSGVRILVSELEDAPILLQEWDLIEPKERGYVFKVDLLRQWVSDKKPISRVKEELDRIQPAADNLYQAALSFYQKNEPQKDDLETAISFLRNAVEINPNHRKANLLLAELLLARNELTEAERLLESLFQYHPSSAKPRLVQVLLKQAQLEEDGDIAEKIYAKILNLEQNQPEATRHYQNIWILKAEEALEKKDLKSVLNAYKKLNLVDKIELVKEEIRQEEYKLTFSGIQNLDELGDYDQALSLAIKLHNDYPENTDLPQFVELLRNKTQLHNLYQKGIGAIQEEEFAAAQSLFSSIVSLNPEYKEASRYLYIATYQQDPKIISDTNSRLTSQLLIMQVLSIVLAVALVFSTGYYVTQSEFFNQLSTISLSIQEAIDTSLVSGQDVPLQTKPESNAPTILSLSGGTSVVALQRDTLGSWVKIRTQTGVVGWVQTAHTDLGFRVFQLGAEESPASDPLWAEESPTPGPLRAAETPTLGPLGAEEGPYPGPLGTVQSPYP